jgi:glucokinase
MASTGFSFPFPHLLCDIGGTNIRFASVEKVGGSLNLLMHNALDEFRHVEEACRRAIGIMSKHPASLLISAAGPGNGRKIQLTNKDWTIDSAALGLDLALDKVLLLNDFEALALAVAAADETSITTLIDTGKGFNPAANMLVLGAGTGLGVAAVAWSGERYIAFPGEGGHITLAAAGEEDSRIFPHVSCPSGRLTAETLISGPGLERLYRARLASLGMADTVLSAADIASRAAHDRSGQEALTVAHFWRLVARFAGDMALVFAARGGVALAGGVLQKLLPLLDVAEFQSCFRDKSPMRELVERMPIGILNDEYAVLHGLARIARRPEDYSLDYAMRCWSAARI